MEKYLIMFAAIFLAELGDKTQIATLAFSAKTEVNRWYVFVASASALVLSSALAVLLGQAAQSFIAKLPLPLISGIVFMVIGAVTIWDYYR